MFFVISYEVDSEELIYVGRLLTGKSNNKQNQGNAKWPAGVSYDTIQGFAIFLLGFGSGAFCLASPMYIVDIAEPDLRGSLTSVFQVMITVGIATVEFLNIEDGVHWNVISGICMGIPGEKLKM